MKKKRTYKGIRAKRTIDRVTVKRLDKAMRQCDIILSTDVIDKIIDLVELIEDRGRNTSPASIEWLKDSWNK